MRGIKFKSLDFDEGMKISKGTKPFNNGVRTWDEKFTDVGLYAEPLKVFVNNIPQGNPSVLDIACGAGNITKYLLDRRPDYQILGIDRSPKLLSFAKANNPKAKFELMDYHEIDTIKTQFNGITCGFCLPYLTQREAVQLIANVSKLLKPFGVFYLSIIEEREDNQSRYEISTNGDQVYIDYRKEEYLFKALKDNNFETLILKLYVPPDKDDLSITDVVLVCKLNKPMRSIL